MLAILSITFPVFAIIGLGYVTTRRGLFTQQDMRVFGKMVINISLPALVFNAVATRAIAEVFDPAYIAAYALGTLLVVAAGLVWFRRAQGLGLTRAAYCTMGTACSNSGYMAFPMMLLAYPDAAARSLAMNVIVENLLIIPICLTCMALGRDRAGAGLGPVIWMVLRDLFRRPLILGLLAGLAVSLSGIALPEAVARLSSLLAMAAGPVALMVIGGSLAGLNMRGTRALAAQVVAGKLFVMPLLVLAGIALVGLTSFAPLSPELRNCMLITAAVPMMGVYPIFGQEIGEEGMASIAMLGATVVSFFTLSALLAGLMAG